MSHHTTELKVVVDVRLRYETNHGQAAVHSIALGDDVGVNTIVGKGFLKALGCIIDMRTGAIEATNLRSKPFPVTEMFPQRYDTDTKVANGPPNPAYTSTVKKLALVARLLNADVITIGDTPGGLNWKMASALRNHGPSPVLSNPDVKPTSDNASVQKLISDASSTSDTSEYDSMASYSSNGSAIKGTTIWGKSRSIADGFYNYDSKPFGSPIPPLAAVMESGESRGSTIWGQAPVTAPVKRLRFNSDDTSGSQLCDDWTSNV